MTAEYTDQSISYASISVYPRGAESRPIPDGKIGSGRLVKIQVTAAASILKGTLAEYCKANHQAVDIHISAYTDLVTPEGMHTFENITVRAYNEFGHYRANVDLSKLSPIEMKSIIDFLTSIRAGEIIAHQRAYTRHVKSLFELADSIMEGPVQFVANRSKSYDDVLDLIEQIAGKDILDHYFTTGEVALGLASKH